MLLALSDSRPASRLGAADVDKGEDRESALLFNTASRFYRLQNWRDAGRSFQEFLERFPRHEDSAEARFAAGYCMNRLGDHAAAVEFLGLAVRDEDTPWQADAHFYQGRSQEALATKNRLAEDERTRRLTEAARSYVEAAALYGKLARGGGANETGPAAEKKTQAQKEEERSRNRNLRVLAIGAQGEALYQANKHVDSADALAVLLEEPTSLSESPYYQRGVYILGLARHALARDNDPRPGAFSEARQALSVAAHSRYAEEALWEKAAYLLARLAHQDGDLDEAVEVYGQVIERGGDRATEASCHRGIALFETQDPQRLVQARKELLVFLQGHSRHELSPKARYYAALCAFDLKDYDEAVAGFDAASEDSEFAGRARLRQGQALLLKNDPDAALAAKILGEAVETLRKDAAAQSNDAVSQRKIAEGLYWRADALVADGGATVEAASVFNEVHTRFTDASPDLAEKALYQEARTLYLAAEYARGAATSAAYRARYSAEKGVFHAESLLLSAKCAFHAPAGAIPESLRREGPRFYREAAAALTDPSEARWARYMSGVALYFLGDYPQAVEALDAVARESAEGSPPGEPPFPELTFYLADSLSQQRRQSVASSADRARWKRASSLYADYLIRAAASDSRATHVPNALVNLGLCHEWLEEHEEAGRTFEKFLQEFPNHELASQVRFELGNARLVTGDLEEAVLAYASAADTEKDSVLAARALYQKAMLERRLERPAGAAETLSGLLLQHGEAVAEQAQLSHDVHFQRGVALLESGQAEEGRARLAEYLELMPESPHETEARNQLGRSLLDGGRPREAIDFLLPVVEGQVAAPGRAQALYLVAWCHSALAAADDGPADPESARHQEEMEAAYRRLIADHLQSPFAVDAMLELGQHLFNRKAHAESKKWLAKAQETLESDLVPAQPADAERARTILERSWFGLGFIAYEQKDFATAAELLDRVMENPESPLTPRATFQAGRALSQAGKHREAVERFRRVADEYKDRAADKHEESLLRLGESYHQLGEYERAIQSLDRLLTEYPEGDLKHEARFARGFALQFSDDHDSAVKAYRKVVAGTRLPVAARAQYHIGECRLEQGRHRDAAREFNTTVANFDFGGDYAEWIRRSLLAAGMAFQEVRDKEAAAAQLSELVQRFPESKEGKAARGRLETIRN
jgi:TolA-binding protein